MITNALNTVGKAVKNSSYRVVTRVNLIYGDGRMWLNKAVMALVSLSSIHSSSRIMVY